MDGEGGAGSQVALCEGQPAGTESVRKAVLVLLLEEQGLGFHVQIQ